jgi:hypothetical protein
MCSLLVRCPICNCKSEFRDFPSHCVAIDISQPHPLHLSKLTRPSSSSLHASPINVTEVGSHQEDDHQDNWCAIESVQCNRCWYTLFLQEEGRPSLGMGELERRKWEDERSVKRQWTWVDVGGQRLQEKKIPGESIDRRAFGRWKRNLLRYRSHDRET